MPHNEARRIICRNFVIKRFWHPGFARCPKESIPNWRQHSSWWWWFWFNYSKY